MSDPRFTGLAPVLRGLAILAVALTLTVVAVFAAVPSFRQQVGQLVAPSGGGENAFLATPVARPTTRVEKNMGADVSSIPASSPNGTVPAVNPLPTAASNQGRYAFLLMGYGGGGHDGAYLTDSLMLVVVDPTRKSLTLLSVPRDSWVPLAFSPNDVAYNKVNTAYAFAQDTTQFTDRLPRYTGPSGPGTFASDTVSRLLGVPIRYYLGMDFQGFREMIDAVGGVDLTVPDSFRARYPINDNPSIDAGWKTVSFTKGLEHMGGERAIEFARARETIDNSNEGSDFARSRRQRLIMQAFKDRVLQPGGLIHLPQLLGIASKHVDTNYAAPDVAGLAKLALDWKDVTIYQTALTSGNYLEDGTGPDGTYVAVPSSPDHSWAQVRAFTRQLWKDPAAGVSMAKTPILVENANGVAGMAGRVTESLLRLGYQVDDPVSGPIRARTRIIDRTGGQAGPLIARLEQDLGLNKVDVVAEAADPAAPAGAPGLVLQLGTDEASLSVTVPRDASAPSSVVGIVKFGVWPYVPPTPTPIPTEVPPVTATPKPLESWPGANPRPFESRLTPPAVPRATQPLSANVVVPSLIGLSEADAQRRIDDVGLMTGYVNYQTAKDVPNHRYFLSIAPGHVLSQSIAPGQTVPRGTKLLLAVRQR